MLKEWFVIVNPVAGSGRGLDKYPQISKLLRDKGLTYEPLFTEHRFHAVELAVSAINSGYRKLIVVGGDGTLHEVINGLFIQQAVDPKEITLAVIPTGDVNNWARSAGIPLRYDKAIDIIARGERQSQDVGVVSYEESHYRQKRYMANAASVGFGTYVLKRTNHLRNKGRNPWRIILSCITSFFRYKTTGLKVWIDDQLVYNDLLVHIAIGTGRYNAGGLLQLPEAVMNDGMLDLSLVRPVHFWHILFRIRHLFDGGIYRIGHILQGRGEKIRIESTPEISVEIDGELMGESPFEFSVLEKAITVVLPTKER